MIPNAYNEDQLVEQPPSGLYATLRLQTVTAIQQTFGSGRTRDLLLPRLLSGQIDVEGMGHA